MGRAGLDSPFFFFLSVRARWQVDSSRLVSDLAVMGTLPISASCFRVAVGTFDMDVGRPICTYILQCVYIFIYIYIYFFRWSICFVCALYVVCL